MATSQKSKSQDLLVSVAESIGSTLGAIAAKADAAKDAIVGGTDTAVKEVKREATKLVRKGKSTVAKARRSKPARNARASARSARVTARKVARKAVTKVRGAAGKRRGNFDAEVVAWSSKAGAAGDKFGLASPRQICAASAMALSFVFRCAP